MNVCQKSCHLNTGTRQTQARNNHTLLSYTSTAVTSVIGDASQVCFPTKVFSLAGVRVGGVRVGSYTHEGVRAKAKTLADVRAARSMVERSLLTCLSSLHDVHPRLVLRTKHRPVQSNHAPHFVDEHGCIDHWGCQPSLRARSFISPVHA